MCSRSLCPRGGFDFWHDPADAARDAQIAANALARGGYAVMGGFAPDGPERCSRLPVARRSAQQIGALFASAFALMQSRAERHRTPAGAEQSFAYALLQRR